MVKCRHVGLAGVVTGKMGGKSGGATMRRWVICGSKNAGLSNLKHYEIHLISAQDGYVYAAVKCYSEENLKIHIGSILVHSALKSDIW